MAAKKTTGKTTSKTTASRTTSKTAANKTTAETPIGEKSCAYPSCSARATSQHGENNVLSCGIHSEIFETQANDGAGIQALMENYKG